MSLVKILVILGVVGAVTSDYYTETTAGYGETEIVTEVVEEGTTGFPENVEVFTEEESTTFRLPTITNAPPKRTTTTTLGPPVVEGSENVGESVIRRPPSPGSSCGCGIPKIKAQPTHSTRVIGGQPAAEGEFPWFAAVTKFQHNKIPRWKVVCGATLINKEFAVSAAHCLQKRHKETLQLAFNVKDIHNFTSDPGVIKRRVKQFLIHPQFDSLNLHNDLALIKLNEPIDFSVEKRVVPICLPRSSRSSFASKNGTFIGYGHTRYGTAAVGPKENSRILMKVDVPIVSHEECLRSKVPTKKNITENMICAGTRGKDACINDSGGPLMAQEDGKTFLVGLASWGIGCALPDYPGVYTKVSQYLKWIKTSTEYVCGS